MSFRYNKPHSDMRETTKAYDSTTKQSSEATNETSKNVLSDHVDLSVQSSHKGNVGETVYEAANMSKILSPGSRNFVTQSHMKISATSSGAKVGTWDKLENKYRTSREGMVSPKPKHELILSPRGKNFFRTNTNFSLFISCTNETTIVPISACKSHQIVDCIVTLP